MKKILTVIWTIIKFIVWVLVIGLLIIIGVQRITKNEKAVAGYRIFTVITESMVPAYNIGDSIVIKYEDPSQLKVGDDITYLGKEESMKDKIVTHRIISIDQNDDGTYKIQTQGIANNEPDPIINESQIYGKVFYKMKIITFINGVTGNLYGMYFAIFLPLGILTFVEFFVFRRLSDNIEDELDESDNKNEYTDSKERKARKDKRNKRRQKRRKKEKKEKNKE